MKTKLFLLGAFILAFYMNLYSQNVNSISKGVIVPNLTVNYLKLKLVDSNYVENGIKGELWVDIANNQLFVVKEITKDNVISWKGTAHIEYDSNENYYSITCSGSPKNCKGEIITDNNGSIIGGKIIVMH